MPQGGVDGYKIKADEIDNEYKVPQAVEAYQRHKQEGAVLMTLYGTPMTVALNQRLEEDKIADDLARLRHRRRGRRQAATRTCSRSPRPIGRRAPRPSSSSRTSSAAI